MEKFLFLLFCLKLGMIWVFEQMNATSGVNQNCIAAHSKTKDTWKCFFAEHTSPFITTPIFPLQSAYDSWQIPYDLDSQNVDLINQYGANLTNLVKNNLLKNVRNGVFLDSCFHHCGEWNAIHIDGKTQPFAFQDFYEGKGEQKAYIQGKPFPCHTCCS